MGYTNEQYLELTSTPPVKRNNDGTTVFKEDYGGLLQISNGKRLTSDQPKEYDNTIYCMGTCVFVGLGAPWDKTFESYLQRIFNSINKKIKVENASQYYAGRYQDIFYNLYSLNTKPGDMILICLQDLQPPGFPFFDVYNYLDRRLEYGEIFLDRFHINENGYRLLAESFYDFLESNNYFSQFEYNLTDYRAPHIYGIPDNLVTLTSPQIKEIEELDNYLMNLRKIRDVVNGKTGAIVMNCNPFTLGHRYLVEYASQRVHKLYVFVVEEDKSFFPFKDRINMVRQGVSDLPNVIVMPSGHFMISSTTFSGYFNKADLQNEIIDPSLDVSLFATKIAPALGISVRFVGEEPFDKVTAQYNMKMREILPKHGIDLIEVPRKKQDDTVISASIVRRLLETNNFEAISKIVPPSTLEYLSCLFKINRN
ncbi:MAG: hypothetical protein IKN41_04025 [Candidatus Methanomethylophilaceae archaeon]|nr:hypothetical protein [Candidatus Methanomethylophilaceae archaeon]